MLGSKKPADRSRRASEVWLLADRKATHISATACSSDKHQQKAITKGRESPSNPQGKMGSLVGGSFRDTSRRGSCLRAAPLKFGCWRNVPL